ncbi:MAG: L,D-transpeptidase, partial [Pseudomonadota bacterium]
MILRSLVFAAILSISPLVLLLARAEAMPRAGAIKSLSASPVTPAQYGDYDLFVDERGRRYLIDPYTGEAVARENGRRLSPREIRRVERAVRRAVRRSQLERELGGLFDLFDEPRRQREPIRRPRRGGDGGFYLDEREAPREDWRRDDGYPDEELARPVDPRDDRDVEVARLPDIEKQPVERAIAPTTSKPKFSATQIAELQVVLDREGFSPGVIDGQWGSNVAKAMDAYRDAKGSLPIAKTVGLVEALARTGGDALTRYTITREDVSGPFISRVPIDYARKAELQSLAYTSVEEKLAERFHMSEAFLKRLNPGRDFHRPGTTITVVAPGAKKKRPVHYIVADKARKQVRGYDRNGKLLVAYPATIGSASTPSPSGKHSVARIALDPEYTYNPKINFQQGTNDKILRIPPGPNGPVGSVWIALSKRTYGIHGTPDPAKIGKTNSNGC